jgi:hypothetical protein
VRSLSWADLALYIKKSRCEGATEGDYAFAARWDRSALLPLIVSLPVAAFFGVRVGVAALSTVSALVQRLTLPEHGHCLDGPTPGHRCGGLHNVDHACCTSPSSGAGPTVP